MGAFSDVVSPSSFTVLAQPDYIFLCGGRLKDYKNSLRAHFYTYKVEPNVDLAQRVQLAETADEWYQSRHLFEDLLELEEYLAGLSACILLFVESPGAIAEFGAFSQMVLLKDKLIVVVEDTHFGQNSFIRNGLIEQAKRLRPESVLSYPWLSVSTPGGPLEIDVVGAADTLDEVEKEVRNVLKKRSKTAAFKKEDHGHLMLLIADLVTLNVIVLQQEIQAILTSLDLKVKQPQLRKYLFLLSQLGLISTFHYGNVDYYLNPNKSGPEYVDYAPKKPTDRARLRNLLRSDFPPTSEKNKALDAFSRRVAGGVR